MKNEIAVRLFSTLQVTPDLATDQITCLARLDNERFRPDKFGDHEPLRNQFDCEDLSDAVLALSRPQGAFIFKQGRPTRLLGAFWNLFYPETVLDDHRGNVVAAHPPPVFCNQTTFDVDGGWVKRIGMDLVCQLAQELFEVSGADYGLVTSLEDLRTKNFVNGIERRGLDPAFGVPGLYWCNMFSRRYAEWLGLERLSGEGLVCNSSPGGRVTVTFGADPYTYQDEDVVVLQTRCKALLGRNRFFDIEKPDEILDAPNWREWGTKER